MTAFPVDTDSGWVGPFPHLVGHHVHRSGSTLEPREIRTLALLLPGYIMVAHEHPPTPEYTLVPPGYSLVPPEYPVVP